MDEDQQLAFGFDVLDPTKFIPEELVPITPLGKMTLNMNPKNYFAETEQIGVSQSSEITLCVFVVTHHSFNLGISSAESTFQMTQSCKAVFIRT